MDVRGDPGVNLLHWEQDSNPLPFPQSTRSSVRANVEQLHTETFSSEVDALVYGTLLGVIVHGQSAIELQVKWSEDLSPVMAHDVHSFVLAVPSSGSIVALTPSVKGSLVVGRVSTAKLPKRYTLHDQEETQETE